MIKRIFRFVLFFFCVSLFCLTATFAGGRYKLHLISVKHASVKANNKEFSEKACAPVILVNTEPANQFIAEPLSHSLEDKKVLRKGLYGRAYHAFLRKRRAQKTTTPNVLYSIARSTSEITVAKKRSSILINEPVDNRFLYIILLISLALFAIGACLLWLLSLGFFSLSAAWGAAFLGVIALLFSIALFLIGGLWLLSRFIIKLVTPKSTSK